jgi:hypothetical protein
LCRGFIVSAAGKTMWLLDDRRRIGDNHEHGADLVAGKLLALSSSTRSRHLQYRFSLDFLDANQLRCNLPGFEDELPGGFRAHSGPIPGGFRPSSNIKTPANIAANLTFC